MLIGLILIAVAMFRENFRSFAVGLGLLTVAALEQALREHRAGYRSHSVLLAAFSALLVVVPLVLVVPGVLKLVVIVLAALIFATSFRLFQQLFVRRSGGMAWRS